MLPIFLSMKEVQTLVLALVLASVVELSVCAFWQDNVLRFLFSSSSFVVSRLSLHKVSSSFLFLYIYGMAVYIFLGCLSAVLDFYFLLNLFCHFFP